VTAISDRQRRGLGVQSLLFIVFLGVVFVGLARPLIDTDLWWHLANGRYILGHGVPSRDVYSHTALGHVWVVHEWLSDVGFYLLYQVGGLRIVLLLAAATVAAGMYMVYRLLRSGGLGNNSAVLIAMVLLVAASPSFGPRPQVLNFVLTGGLLVYLVALRRHPTHSPWRLLLLFVLWANLHSGYVVGVGLLGVFVFGEYLQTSSRRFAGLRQEGVPPLPRPVLRRLAMVVPLGFLCGLLTPATWRTLVFALGTLSSSSIQSFITEWSSPDFHQPWGMALMVILLITVGGLVAARPGADPTFLLWGLSGIALALTSQRHVPIFAVAAAPLVGQSASGLLAAVGLRPRVAHSPSAAAARLNMIILVVLAVLGAVFLSLNLSTKSIDGAVAAAEPVAATDWILSHRPQRELFNEYKYGGWLVWKAGPAYPVFIDGRVEVYGEAVFNEYLRTEYLTNDWQEPLKRFGINTILVTSGDRLQLLLPDHGWRLAYHDDVAQVWVRD